MPVSSRIVTIDTSKSTLAAGAYTLPDAARLLNLPLPRLRTWVSGSLEAESNVSARRYPAGRLSSKGAGRDRTFSFLTLIELFSIAQLRARGVSMGTLRTARTELAERYQTPHPFALEGLLTDGRKLLKELGDASLLELCAGGQTSFASVIVPFCHRLDFDANTRLATRFFLNGRTSIVVVDPHHSFGRPTIDGTNITTEAIASLIRGGEKIADVAADFRLDPSKIEEAWGFEVRLAA